QHRRHRAGGRVTRRRTRAAPGGAARPRDGSPERVHRLAERLPHARTRRALARAQSGAPRADRGTLPCRWHRRLHRVAERRRRGRPRRAAAHRGTLRVRRRRRRPRGDRGAGGEALAMSIPAHCIRRPVAVAMLFAAIVFLGLISFVRLPIDLLPDLAYPRLVVYTAYPNVAPAEVERFVTERIEQAVSAVPGVEHVESLSREGTSLVTLRFAWGTDMDFAALNVREKLDNLRDQLPTRASRPVVLRTDPNSEPIITLSVAGSTDLWTLKDLA